MSDERLLDKQGVAAKSFALRNLTAASNVDLTDVADGELLEGVMHVTGQLQEGIEPFETRIRSSSTTRSMDATRDPPVAPRTPDVPQRRWLA